MSKYRPLDRQIYRDLALEQHKIFRDRLENIRSDAQLSPEGKRAAIASAYTDARNKITNAQAAEEAHASDRRAYLEADLFGMSPIAGGADFMSYRDAYDRVANIPPDGAKDAASRLLTQAERSSDSHLAKAVIQRAMEEEWVEILNSYAETHAGTAHKLQELFDLTAGTSTTFGLMAGFVAQGTYNLPVPGELGALSLSEIDELAA